MAALTMAALTTALLTMAARTPHQVRKAARKDLDLKLGDAKATANMLQRRLAEATHKAAQGAASQAALLGEHYAWAPSPSP